jgi:ferredoxin
LTSPSKSRSLGLLDNLQHERDLTLLFVTRNLDLARMIANRAVVHNEARVVETGVCAGVLDRPWDVCTQALIGDTPNSRRSPRERHAASLGAGGGGDPMAYVIGEACIGEKNRSCIEVCPVDCIFEAERMLIIEPDACIDCGACLPECPVDAIMPADALPPEWAPFIDINAAWSRGGKEAVEAALSAHLVARD